MKNADGVVGPWSENLRVTVPVAANFLGIRAKPHHSHKGLARESGKAETIGPTPTPSPTSSPSQLRFDLLVPALIEAFSRLVDDGSHWITAGARPFPAAPLRPRGVQGPTNACVDRNRGSTTTRSSSAVQPCRQRANQTSELPWKPGFTSGHISRPDGGGFSQRRQHQREEGVKWDEANSTRAKDNDNLAAWEEYWDEGRHAPFYRLHEQDLSLWQVPFLQDRA